jgi:hypothetical protein
MCNEEKGENRGKTIQLKSSCFYYLCVAFCFANVA